MEIAGACPLFVAFVVLPQTVLALEGLLLALLYLSLPATLA